MSAMVEVAILLGVVSFWCGEFVVGFVVDGVILVALWWGKALWFWIHWFRVPGAFVRQNREVMS